MPSDDQAIVRPMTSQRFQPGAKAPAPFANLHPRTPACAPAAHRSVRSKSRGQQSATARHSDGVVGQTRNLRWQQYVTGDIGQLKVASDYRNDYGLNPTAVKGIRLADKHWPPITRFGATRFGKIGPPDLSPTNLIHFLPGFPRKGFQLGAMQCGIHRRPFARVHLVQSFGDGIRVLAIEEFRNRRGI
jgi:hypothetical protein